MRVVHIPKRSRTASAARHAMAMAAACAAVVGGALTSADAATTQTWIGGTSGELLWGVATNWSPNNVPDAQIATGDPETALINDATTGDRNITTPVGNPITVDLDWTNPAGGTGINKITLGSNFFFAQTASPGTHSNTFVNNRTADTMVLDLNGFNMAGAWQNDSANAQSRHNLTSLLGAPLTITNSAAGVATILGSNATVSANGAIIGSGVHLSQNLQNPNTISGVTFQDGSILSIVGGPTRSTAYPTAGVWDLNFTTTGVLGSNLIVRNDFAISGAGSIFFNITGTGTRAIRVGGDFSDVPTTVASDYAYGATGTPTHQIIFNGGLVDDTNNPVVRTVELARTGVSKVQFYVGDPAVGGKKSHLQLAADFSTTGTSSVRVVDGSILDVAGFDLTTPTVTFDDNTTLLLAFNDLAPKAGASARRTSRSRASSTSTWT